jgi:hypothetical protein
MFFVDIFIVGLCCLKNNVDFWLLFLAGANSFLVRSSDNSPGNYTLFFLCNHVVQRFKIEKVGRQLVMGGRYFDE